MGRAGIRKVVGSRLDASGLDAPSPRARAALILGMTTAYALAFLLLHPVLGSWGVGALSMLPIAVTGWHFGLQGGLLAGLLAFPLNTLLLNLAGRTDWDVVIRDGGVAASAILVLLGAVIGRMSDLGEQVKRELAERKRTEKALRESEDQIIQRNRELLTLQAAGAAITSSLDLQNVLNTVNRELTNLLGVEGCAISEWNQTDDTVSLIAEHGPNVWVGEVFHLADYPLTRRVLVERRYQQMTISQPDIDPAELALMREAGLKTLLMLPMVFQDRVVGLIAIVDGRIERTFTDQEISLAQLLANQAVSAIENAQLFEAEHEQRALAEALRDTATALNSTPNFDEVLDRILANVGRVVPHDEANIMLVKSGAAHVVRSRGYAERGLEATALALRVMVADVPSLRQMAESGQPLTIPNTWADPGWVEFAETRRVRSYVGAPIRPKGQVVGFLNLNSATPGFFTRAHAERLQVFADRAAIALENAQLYDALHRHADELEQRVVKRTRELAEANERLQRLDRLKDEFLASMSHELRTPLNAILGLSEALQEQVYGLFNEKQLKSLRIIEESGRHLLSLITDILDLSKIGAGKMELEIRPVSVESVCQASLQFIKQAAHKKQLKVSLTLDSTVTTLHADERRLKQILVNLLSNAVKFTHEGGAIGLEVVGDAAQHVVHFTVWDTGMGISQENRVRLFQPFIQLDSSLSRQHSGTGLGLALVQRMTQMHGGSVSVESEVEKGSRFTVSLPWQGPAESAVSVGEAEAAESDTPPPALDPDRRTERPLILLAEDSETTMDMLSDYLSAKKYRVIVARNGSEAIERARTDRPDVILMDIQMPGVDGLEATHRLRADADLATVPIIALTALTMPGDRERCLAAGADEHLSKPVRLQELSKAIEAQLNRNQISEAVLT